MPTLASPSFPTRKFAWQPGQRCGCSGRRYRGLIRYAVAAIREMRQRGARFVDVRPAIQERYNANIQRRFEGTVWSSGCHAWYQTANGKHTVLYPDLTARFFLETRRFDAENYDFVVDQTRERSAGTAAGVTAARSP